MSGHYSPLASDFFSATKIEWNFQSRQIFSAGYNTRLYKYIGIYNRYSGYRWLNSTAKITSPHRTFQITPVMVLVIPLWLPSFPL